MAIFLAYLVRVFHIPLSRQAYFEGFGPKYVEWLSDWSFNVVFEDENEAKRAAASKSFALPEVLPQDVRVRMLGRLCVAARPAPSWCGDKHVII